MIEELKELVKQVYKGKYQHNNPEIKEAVEAGEVALKNYAFVVMARNEFINSIIKEGKYKLSLMDDIKHNIEDGHITLIVKTKCGNKIANSFCIKMLEGMAMSEFLKNKNKE